MKELDFVYNWNNKLNNHMFTSFRIYNPEKYVTGERFFITQKGRKIYEATLIAQRKLFLKDVNEFIAGIDTGYSVPEFIEIVKKMYKNKNLNFETQYFSLLLFKSDKTTVEMPEAINDKIGLFCRKYEQYKKVKYKTSASESGKIKLISITESILDHYFISDNFLFKDKHSISNLAKYYNELIAEMNKKASGDSGLNHPNFWSAKHANKLTGSALSSYYVHLLGLGLESKKDKFGNITDFIKRENNQTT